MSRSEQPSPAAGLSYEGRALPRPDDEVVDQGLAFDITTLFNRRRALQFLGVGAAGGVLAACGVSSSTGTSGTSASASAENSTGLTEIPDETAGPYPGDGSNGPDVLEQSGVVRSDIRSSFGGSTTTAEGIGMTLTLTVLDIAAGGTPMSGAAVYVWHCDRAGEYSMYSQSILGENYLRGVQITDDSGAVTGRPAQERVRHRLRHHRVRTVGQQPVAAHLGHRQRVRQRRRRAPVGHRHRRPHQGLRGHLDRSGGHPHHTQRR